MSYVNIPIKSFFVFLRQYISQTYSVLATIEFQQSDKEQMAIIFASISNMKNTEYQNETCDISVHFDYIFKFNRNDPYEVIDKVVNIYSQLARVRGLDIDVRPEEPPMRLIKSAMLVNPFLEYAQKDSMHLRCEILFSVDLAASRSY